MPLPLAAKTRSIQSRGRRRSIAAGVSETSRSRAAPRSSSPRPTDAVDGDDRRLLEERPGHTFGDLERRQLQPLGVDQVRLGEGDHAVAHPHHLEDPQVLLGLRLPALAGGDDEQAGIDGSDAGQHVRQEPHMTRHVDEADRGTARQHRVGEAEVDRQPTPSLLLEPVRVDPGQRQHQRRLAVIDVTCGGDDPHRASADSAGDEHVVVVRIDTAQVEQRPPVAGAPDDRRVVAPQRVEMVTGDGNSGGRDGDARGGPGAGQRLGVDHLADGAGRHDLRRPPPELGERLIDHPPEGDVGRDRAMEI